MVVTWAQPAMASRPRSAGSMIRASSFSDMGRAARIEEWGAAGARQRGSDDAKVSRTRSSSTAGRVGPRRPSEPAAVAAGNWNELVALSPQVLLDRLTKGVEKGRSWLGTQMEGPPLAERPKKSKEAGSHGRRSHARQRPPSTSTAAVAVPATEAPTEPTEPTPEPEPLPSSAATCAAASPKDAGRKDAEASPEGSRAAPAPAAGPPEKARCRPFSGGYAGELSRIEAEALLQRLTAQSGNLDEVRRLRKLLDERSET